jgi:hypothetical protein
MLRSWVSVQQRHAGRLRPSTPAQRHFELHGRSPPDTLGGARFKSGDVEEQIRSAFTNDPRQRDPKAAASNL